MKLLVVLPRLDGGGMERMQLNLLHEFQQQGIETILVVGQLKGELVAQIPPQTRVLEIAPKGPLFFYSGLVRTLCRYRPTHILSAADDVNCLVLLVNRLLGKPARVVVSVHHTLSQQIMRVQGVHRLKLLFIRFVMRWLYPGANGVVAVSKGAADDLSEQLRMPRSNISVIYNPVVTSDFLERMSAPTQDIWGSAHMDPVIIYVGRLVPLKRLDLLLKAFEHVVAQRAVRLLIVGDGPMHQWVLEEISRRGLGAQVRLSGFVSNVLSLICSATVLVLPSDHEGLPTVLIEALACGTQIISTDSPSGPREILEDGKWGKLVPIGNAVALATALIEILDGRFHVPAEQLQARAAHFSASRAAQEYLSILKSTADSI